MHPSVYLDALAAIREEAWLDPDTPVGPTSWEAALLAAGCAIEAVERDGFALVRPPGHHALPDRAMGFCLLGNAAVMARHAQAALGLQRVAILDWDVHHGNGTEAVFRDDPTVLFVSLHGWPAYPGTGGPGTSDATTVNIPLPAGSGDREALAAFDGVAAPAIEAFRPDALIVSAGFDAWKHDPLGELRWSETCFRELARRASGLAPRVSAVLEGGYDVAALPSLVAAALDGFAG